MGNKVKKKLTDENYWQKSFGKIDLYKFNESIYSKYIKKYLKVDEHKNCIEIGAYPGNILGWICKTFKYNPVALDYIPEVNKLNAIFQYNDINNLKTIRTDFLTWVPEEEYDVVCSFGFVEHFEDYEYVVSKHAQILQKEGTLIIGVPYLNYFQLWVRKFFYKPERLSEVLRIHNQAIMNLKTLRNIIENKTDLHIEFASYIGESMIWFGEDQVRQNRLRLFRFVKFLTKAINKLGVSNKFISPAILVIAKK